jgi:exosortase B
MTDPIHNAEDSPFIGWYFLFAGFLALYFFTFWDLFHGLWRTDQNAHGPIVLTVAAWFLVYRFRRIDKDDQVPVKPAPIIGWFVFAIGLLVFVVGRSQSVYLFEIGSLIPVIAGAVLILFGIGVCKKLWFALFFLLFAIPLPGSVTDSITQPMKIFVSWGTEHILYSLGYPIARSGVVLSIGQYKLLVADACAGLNSLFSLEALGLLYLNVVRHSSVLRNFALAILIVPISLTTNLIRVMLLSLITYYFGDEAGQGFVHSFSGMLLFMTALLLTIAADSALRAGVKIGKVAGMVSQ